MSDEIYISVDIETSGPIPGEFSMLSFGASVVGKTDCEFYAELKPISENFVPEALAVSGFDLTELKSAGEEPKAAMNRFNEWIETSTGGARAIFVGFNAGFDWSFVNWYFHKFLGENPFGFAPLDIKAYYMGAYGCLWSDTTSSKLPPELQPETKATHNALDDARSQGEMFSKLLLKNKSNNAS